MASVETSKYEIFRYGSSWLRADFHLHTKADHEFSYTGEENSFLNDYVAKLKDRDIRVGVITNHNKFNMDEFKNLRKKACKEEIFLLAGVELSIKEGKNGIHTLIVFSDQWFEKGQDYINPFLNVAFEGKTPEQYENENGRTSLSLNEIIKKLEGYNRDYFIVFAHVEQDNGLWSELDGGRIIELGLIEIFKQRTLAFQKVRTHDVQEGVYRTKIKSWLGDWYPAEVEGSDCKSLDEIGKGEVTYLKIGDFTFEAVKYALSDYPNRVSAEKPAPYKHSHIKRIAFEGGILDRQTVTFSPELNSFIGIRGSGKSSVLEALRYVLDISLSDKAQRDEYKRDLPKHTLGSGGKVIITAIDQYGQEYEIMRILNEASEVFINGKLQPGVSIRETIIRKPRYFGQKDLSDTSEGFEKDLVERLVGEKLYDIRKQIGEKRQAVAEAVAIFQKLTNIGEQKKEYTQIKQDAEYNLRKYVEYGVAEKFKKQTDYEADERKLEHIIKDTGYFIDEYKDFIGRHGDEIKNHRLYQPKQAADFFADFFNEYDKLIASFGKAKTNYVNTEAILKNLKTKLDDFKKQKAGFLEEFANTRRTIEAELKTKGTTSLNLEEFPKLQSKIDTANKMLEALSRQELQKDNLKNELLQALSVLNDLWHREFQMIQSELSKLNDNNSSLVIEGEFKGDKKEFLAFMQSMFKGSKIRESTFSSLLEKYSDFSGIYKDMDSVKQITGSSAGIFESYFMENLQELLKWQVPNSFTIKYRGKELKHHSLGQRASALILFVLSQQENDCIIIDQPEDDLDNQTIYEDVIKMIRQLKRKTQFVFATHNANFPVLGDAEQIHSCKYADETMIVHSGSIDSPRLQKEIVDVMEGGEDAFKRRKEIYSIWKPQS